MSLTYRFYAALLGVLVLAAVATAAQAEVKPFKLGSFAALRQGQSEVPLIVMFWGIDCVHCKANMQVFKDLRARYPALQIVLVATDYTDQQEEIARIVQHHGLADAPVYAFAEDADWVRRDVDKKWRGEIPRTYFFDGEQRMTAVSGRVDAGAVTVWAAQHGTGSP